MRFTKHHRRVATAAFIAVGALASAAVLAVAPAADAAPVARDATTPAAAMPRDGSFPLTFVNKAAASYPAGDVYVTVMGMASPGQWSYLRQDGTLAHINHLDVQAPEHLTKNGIPYPNMSFTLAQASTVNVPPHLEGARAYISLGSPMYFGVSPDDTGWAGPDLNNPADPNKDVLFDWYEFTYQHGKIPFGGNTTQVDMLGFPMTARLEQSSSHYDKTVGIDMPRAEVFQRFRQTVDPAFAGLEDSYRITAPRTASSFGTGGSQQGYLDEYINRTWQEYTDHQFTLSRLNQTFTGRVIDGELVFTKDGAGPYVLNKPTTHDVLACSGALASAGMNTTELELGAEFCAAFNRGVAMNTADWYNPSTYYQSTPNNEYSHFMHAVNVGNRAYGFAYDDINDQSSVCILDNSNPPSSLTITIEPMS
jgi:hypothetical protein